jgi:hypothetical protein
MSACDLKELNHVFCTFCQNDKRDERRHLKDEKLRYVKEYSVRRGESLKKQYESSRHCKRQILCIACNI